MVYDQRFAVGYISTSGEGGAKLHRRNWGEVVENVADVKEYQLDGWDFLKYAARSSGTTSPLTSMNS